ncbi:Nucleoporin [Lachnellula occidentalis]|uniref:Nucleoporin NUP188 n=1 Tax=Lachnellula occidentalis TaxID=215460 RepID=A0A8H8RWD8_9HELO|nr:Nucleoporin [Lachnellula occidentalis]
MVPLPASSYFPPLNECLTGEQLLISWRTVSSAIEGSNGADEPAIQRFLADPAVLRLLSRPFDAYPPHSQQTKAAFETKSSAINVTPSSTLRFDIKQVKEDALWLSGKAQIDETSALRVVVEECQSRAAARLSAPFSEDELINIRETAGNSTSPVTLCLASRGRDGADIQAEFDTEDHRRQRVFMTYLSERRHLLKCVELLLSAFMTHKIAIPDNGNGNGKGKGVGAASTWLESYGQTLATEIGQLDGFVLKCFQAIEKNIKNIDSGSGWPALEIEWIRNQLTEATHTMEIVFQTVEFNNQFSSSDVVLTWLTFMRSYDFLDGFHPEEPTIQILLSPLRCAASMVSVCILSVGSALDFLYDYDPRTSEALISSDSSTESQYLLNTDTLSAIHQILVNAAGKKLVTAGPVLLAWSFILKALHGRIEANTAAQIDERESRRFDRQSSTDTDATLASDPYESMVKSIMEFTETPNDNPIELLVHTAIDSCRALESLNGFALRLGNTSEAFFSKRTGGMMRIVILDLMKSCRISGLDYQAEVMEPLLSALSGGQSYWDLVNSKDMNGAFDPVAIFLEDQEMLDTFLTPAIARYPYESLPFLRIIHAISTCSSCLSKPKSALTILEAINTFTYQLPDGFVDYETTQEEDNNNNVLLKRAVNLFAPRPRSMPPGHSSALTLVDKDFCVSAGTLGRMLSDSPKIVFWFHQYSGLKYFGKLLETFLTASDLVDATTDFGIDRDSTVEVIDILASLLLSTSNSSVTNANFKDDARHVLESASSGLDRNRDIITVIFDIFEEELQRQSSVSGSDVPLGVLVSCVHFIHALIPISPDRVWPLLSRSGLLGVARGKGTLSTIVEGVELVSGRYDFLISCARLYEALVEDIASNAIKRRSGVKASARYTDHNGVGTGVPDLILSKIILSFSRYLIDVLESSFLWKFVTENDRRLLTWTLSTTFNKVLEYVFGIEAAADPVQNMDDTLTAEAVDFPSKSDKASQAASKLASRITGILIPSASHIVDSFLASSSNSLRFQPLLVSCLDGLSTPDSNTFLNEATLWKSQVTSVLILSKTLLRVSNYLDRPVSQLEHSIFKIAPLIARLYVVNELYRKDVVALFEALIITANNGSEPPSLLGHLGQYAAKNFLHVLSDLDRPLTRDTNTTAIWHFLSMIVSNKQQWFANYLLTGKTPRDAVGLKPGNGGSPALDKPLLTIALETLSNIHDMPKSAALPILEFVSLSQNFWPWTVYESPKHGEFIKAILEYVQSLPPLQPSSKLEGSINACLQTKVLAYIAELLAMHLFHSRQTGTPSSMGNLSDTLQYYFRFAVGVPSLNSSLHTQLKRNFEARYPGCTPQDLKRTSLKDRQVGKDYFYDLRLADKMLCLDQAWTGRKNDGLRLEFETANVNLSLVDAQIALFHSWKILAIETTCTDVSKDVKLQQALIKTSIDCLVANSRSQYQEEIFSRLCHQRADFALVLTQRLIEARCTDPGMKQLLKKSWETIRELRGTFDRELVKEDAPYYRSLLKLLFISIRAHSPDATEVNANLDASVRMSQSAPIIPVILDIIKYVVSTGFRQIASAIHENAAESSPEDIALITGIFQSCLRVPGIELCQSQIVSIMAANGTARVATTLFSWSDSLAVDGDPVYGELSILFLLELSTMPLMAEQLAIDGILGHIASANITSYIRRGNVSPFAEGAGLQRCYSIWQRGILPLLLNLLDAVQASIAVEVALFLNQFAPLLDQSVKALEAPESSRTMSKAQTMFISLSMCSEVHSLALLNYILNSFPDLEVPDVKWDAPAVLENVEFWLGARAILREKIVPMGVRDIELAKQKHGTLSHSAGARLEERIVDELIGIRDILGAEP